MMDIKSLNDRSRLIFQHIVESWVETGDPVGSRTLSRTSELGVSPATIRNVMADLEDAGLLVSPHTSAGRIPTDTGLRLFVDGILEVGNLSKDERESIRGKCSATGQNPSDILAEATRALSGLSHCASLVMVDKAVESVRQIEFVPLGNSRALVVLVSSSGNVENRIISLPIGLPPSALIMAGNYLTAKLAGRTLNTAQEDIKAELESQQAELDSLTSKVVQDGVAVWSGDQHDTALIISGQANLLENVQAGADLERIRLLLADLERKREMVGLLDLAKTGNGVQLFIGSENNLFSLSGSSLVLAPYMSENNSVVGVIGVIGPTRLNYSRIIPMVDFTARMVGKLL